MKLADTGLRKQPFRTHGPPLILVPYASQKAAVRFLNHTRSTDNGLGLLRGPTLSGKTSIIRQFAASLPNDDAVAVVDVADMEASAILRQVLNQFGYDLGLDSPNECFNMIKVFAMQQTASSYAPLLIIENAHTLDPISLETLCELADLNVNGKSALQMILASDRPMLPIVRAPAMQSISKRVSGEFLLRPLTRKETTKYLYKKLISGGCGDPQSVLPPAVCDGLYAASGGWPGMIDRLTLLALSKAERCPVRIEHVRGQPQPVKLPAGVTTLGLPASKRRAPKTGDSAPHLILTCRGKTLKRVVLDSPRLLIGRGEYNDLRIVSDGISRQHAILFRVGSATIVVDLKSRNGTFVNGKRISNQVLTNNDVISLHEHRIKFIDPAARRRATVRGAVSDETTISKSIKGMRNAIAKRWSHNSAS